MFKISLLILTTAIPLLAPLSAQEGGDSPKTLVRFLPLGMNPPIIIKQEGNVLQEQEAAEGAIPPRNIMVAPQSNGAEPLAANLRLKRMTPYLEVPRGASMKLYEGKEARGKEWTAVPGLKGPSTVVFFRDPAAPKRDWGKVRFRAFRDDLSAFPKETIRFVNMTRADAVVRVGEKGKSVAVKAGQVKILGKSDGFKVGGSTIVPIGVKLGNKWVKQSQNGIDLYDNERVSVYFFENDVPNEKGVIKSKMHKVVLPEPAREPVIQP